MEMVVRNVQLSYAVVVNQKGDVTEIYINPVAECLVLALVILAFVGGVFMGRNTAKNEEVL